MQIRKHPALPILVREDGFISLIITSHNQYTSWTKQTEFKRGWLRPQGYYSVECNNTAYYVHALVAETYLGPRPEGMVIDHINRDKTDNRVCNLRWATHREQRDNSSQVLDSVDYGVRSCDDPKGYKRNYMKEYMNRPGKKEHKQAYDRARYEAKKNKRLANEG